MYKKKKKKKTLIIILVLLIVAVVAGVIIFNVKKNDTSDTSTEEEIVLSSNQELQYVTIQKILGNEMTVYTTDGDETATTTWTIPVGTDVVTKLGTTTTFSRLAAGDQIKMVVETTDSDQEIIKIWIVN